MLSDFHTRLLLHVDFPNEDLTKPQPNCEQRTPEFHLKELALTKEEESSLREAMEARPELDPRRASKAWLRGTQMALYEWAKENGKVVKKTFNNPEAEQRPPQGTADPHPSVALPSIADRLDILPTPAELTEALTVHSGLEDPTAAELKTFFRREMDLLLAQWTVANRQRLGRN